MRIGICDDLQEDRNRLIRLVTERYRTRGEEVEICEYESAEELLHQWQDGWLSYLFLDVYMEGMSGMEAARRIRQSDANCVIIFTTTSTDHAMDSYEVRAADYLVKPYGAKELDEALRWCEETGGMKVRELEVISDRERRRIAYGEITYIEIYGRVSIVHTEKEQIRTNRGLSELEAELDDDRFLRCHRSYLVNMEHIQRPQNKEFLMKNQERVPIAAENAGKFRQAFFEWVFRRSWGS